MQIRSENQADVAEPTLRARAAAARQAAHFQKPESSIEARFGQGRAYADQFDFALFSVREILRLHAISKSAHDHWDHVGDRTFCTASNDGPYPSLTPVGWFVRFEEDRMAFLRDRCVRELEARVPVDDDERDAILEVRITHELDCNGKIDSQDAPGLLIEALKAWG